MVQDGSDSVIVVVCSRAAVADVVSRLRARAEHRGVDAVAEVDQGDAGAADAVGFVSVSSDHAVRVLQVRHGLTDMQCVVLGLRFRGWTNAAVADAVGIEVGTVKAHVHGAKQRIGEASSTRIDVLFRRLVTELATRPLDLHAAAAMGQCSWYRTLLTAARHSPDGRASDSMRAARARGPRVDDPKVDGSRAGTRPA